MTKDEEIVRLKVALAKARKDKEASADYARDLAARQRDEEQFQMEMHGYRGQD